MTAILHSTREQWLATRRDLVTASDVAAILGVDSRRDAMAVYADKLGAGEVTEIEVMTRGREFEEPIARAYARQTGREVRALSEFEIQTHPDVPWLGATLDRVVAMPGEWPLTDGGVLIREKLAPLQLKLAGGSAAEWAEEAPVHYAIQVQIEMACFGSRWGALAGLVATHMPLVTYDFQREDEFLSEAMPALERFRWHVKTRTPPPPTALSLAPLKRLYPGSNGETLPLDLSALDDVVRWERAKAAAKAADEAVDEIEAKLRARVGEYTFGALPDGSFLTLKTTKRAGYVAGPCEYRALRRTKAKGVK